MDYLLQKLLLVLTPILFVADLVQSLFYLREADAREQGDHLSHPVYYVCFGLFFAAMLFALLAPSLPLMWVAIELTTLVSAPLIAYHRTKESLEAMWKYLLICSIGIGLALDKTFAAAPEPKFLIAAGACAISGGLYVRGTLPAEPALFIPGCPPHPATTLEALLRFTDRAAFASENTYANAAGNKRNEG